MKVIKIQRSSPFYYLIATFILLYPYDLFLILVQWLQGGWVVQRLCKDVARSAWLLLEVQATIPTDKYQKGTRPHPDLCSNFYGGVLYKYFLSLSRIKRRLHRYQ